MHLTLLGDFDQLYFLRALKQVEHFLAIPKNVHLYVLSDGAHSRFILERLPPSARPLFKSIAKKKISFSYFYKSQRLIIITISSQNSYLLEDTKALIGILLHELYHLEHMRKGTYKLLQQSYHKVLKTYAQLLRHLKLKRHLPLLERIGQDALFLLKDLYTNSALLEQGYGHYLLHYYECSFSEKKVCPRPMFYDKLKRAIQKDPTILQIVFSFEFALLSVILPFKKYKERHAKALLTYVQRCYNLNMREMMRKCGPFIEFYLHHYNKPSRDFQEKYLHLIFTKVLELLT